MVQTPLATVAVKLTFDTTGQRLLAAERLLTKVGLPPIVRLDARVLILGSLPGDASLSASEYYAHPRNQFWILLSGVVGHDLTKLDYKRRVDLIQNLGIALWDVVHSGERPGSLDHHIRRARLNDLRDFAGALPELRAIAFNGKKAAMLAANVFGGLSVDMLLLPSSSPAYTLALENKAAVWGELIRYLNRSKDCKVT